VDLDAYASTIAAHLAPYDVTAAFEPGDFVMKDAAVLLAEVVSVERRGGLTFVGLDVGWNVNCAYFIYRYAQEILPLRDPMRERTQLVTVAGHINEAGDVFAEDYPFPDVAEGEAVAILNAGGYLQAMATTHCLRPTGTAVYLDRPAAP
jgi:diaminopimelate decarboxylase